MTFDKSRSHWLRETLSPRRPTHIVDVGANPIEPVPYEDLLRDNGCKLTDFEPQAEAFAKLQKIKSPNEEYHQFAVGDGKTSNLNLMAHDSMTSFFEGDMQGTKYLQRYGHTMRVKETVQLDTVALDQSNVADFDVLKIDVQGGEKIVFDGASDKLPRAIAVIPEARWYQLYKGEPMFAGIDQYLRARGFALHKFLFNKGMPLLNSQYNRLNLDAYQNQLIDGDAVYIRDLAYVNKYNAEQMKHFAILSDAVWFSFDLALRCLDHLVRATVISPEIPAAYVDRLPLIYRTDTPPAGPQ